MYSLYNDPRTNQQLNIIIRLSDNACIPFDSANIDYSKFKIDLANTQITNVLSDANNNVMTANQVSTFLSTLP